MKRSVNFARTRKSRNTTNDIAAFLSDTGITAEMIRAEQEAQAKLKRDADEAAIQAFLTQDWERIMAERAAWDRGESADEDISNP